MAAQRPNAQTLRAAIKFEGRMQKVNPARSWLHPPATPLVEIREHSAERTMQTLANCDQRTSNPRNERWGRKPNP